MALFFYQKYFYCLFFYQFWFFYTAINQFWFYVVVNILTHLTLEPFPKLLTLPVSSYGLQIHEYGAYLATDLTLTANMPDR